MSWIEDAKRQAVLEALRPIKNGWVVGVGSGTTTAYAVVELARLAKGRRMEISIVPTSYQIENLAHAHGLKTLTLNEAYVVDYAIDGADQVEHHSLNLIKGGGGALLREKVVDASARQLAIVVDETKLSKTLGGKQRVPLEILPFAHKYVQTQIARMGGRAKLREGAGKVGPVVTDNGNFVLDADFGKIEKPLLLEKSLKRIPGLLVTGLFLGMVDLVYVGLRSGGVRVLSPA